MGQFRNKERNLGISYASAILSEETGRQQGREARPFS